MLQPGAELRKLRLAVKLTQERCAEAADVSRVTIQNREGGKHKPDWDERPAYAAALGISLDSLNLVIDGKISAEECLARESGGQPTSELVSPVREQGSNRSEDAHEGEGNTNRRQFISLVLTGGPGAMAAALETVRNGLVSTLATHATATSLHPDEWTEVAWEYGHSYLALPPESLAVDLAVDLLELHDQLRRETRTNQRQELSRVAGLLSALMAMTLTNMGQLHAARRWWRAARQAADASVDPLTRVWVRGKEAITLLYTHRSPSRALMLADEALGIGGVEHGSTAMAAKAQALALLQRDAEARCAVQAIEPALAQMSASVVEDELTVYGWPENCLRHTESYVYSHIGDTAAARIAQDRALALYSPAEIRSRALVQLHGALCFAHDGYLDDAGQAASVAVCELHPTQRSTLVQQVARRVLSTIPTVERSRPAVAELSRILTPTSGSPSHAS